MYTVGTAKLTIELFRLCTRHRIRLVNRRNVPIHCLDLIFALLDRKAEEIIAIGKCAKLLERDLCIRTRGCLNIALHIEIEPRRRRTFRHSGTLRLTRA